MEDAIEFHGYTGIRPDRFYHSSRKFIPCLMDHEQPTGPVWKPRGLWYDVGGSWIEWMVSEMPGWYADARFLYEVVPSPAARILRIGTAECLERFVEEYGVTHPSMGRFPVPDWCAVSREWDGIEFTPYMWQQRYNHIWYSMIDVSSGCVWRARAATVQLVSQRGDA